VVQDDKTDKDFCDSVCELILPPARDLDATDDSFDPLFSSVLTCSPLHGISYDEASPYWKLVGALSSSPCRDLMPQTSEVVAELWATVAPDVKNYSSEPVAPTDEV